METGRENRPEIRQIPPFAGAVGADASAVQWTGGFYRERFDVNADVTVGHLQNMFASP